MIDTKIKLSAINTVVTSISENSTDNQLPTAKSVYDFIDTKKIL